MPIRWRKPLFDDSAYIPPKVLPPHPLPGTPDWKPLSVFGDRPPVLPAPIQQSQFVTSQELREILGSLLEQHEQRLIEIWNRPAKQAAEQRSYTVTSVTTDGKCPVCGKVLTGKKQTCSNACRMEFSRRNRGLK